MQNKDLEKKEDNFLKQLGKSAGIFALYLLVLPALCLSIFGVISNEFTSYSLLKQNLLYLGAEFLMAVIVAFIFRKQFYKDLINFKKDFKSNIKYSLKYLIIGMLLMMLTNFLINIVFFRGSLAANESANRLYLEQYTLYALITFIILGPIVEELIFRLNFRNCIKNNTLFILISSLIFALIHIVASDFSYTQLLYLIPYGTLGWAFAKTYIKTNNILYSIIIHSIQNAISVLVILTTVAS